jgi:DNA-binding MarR family transcriptional regulator
MTNPRDTDVEFEPRVLAGLLIKAAEQAKSGFAAAVSAKGLTAVQARALLALDQPVAMSDLAGQLGCDASNITGIADRLARAGLVERVPGQDRRVKVLTLTPRGRQLRAELRDHLADSQFPIDRLTRPERDQLKALLRTLLGEE